jgi:hypothetical protein
MYNCTFEILTKLLKGDELNQLREVIQEKQAELSKNRNNFGIKSSKEQRKTVRKFFARPTRFVKIPRKVMRVDRMATIAEVKSMLQETS